MVSVALDWATIDHLVLDERIEVRVGRTSVLTDGEPSSCSLTLWLAEWVDVGYGSALQVSDGGTVRFAGRVTDIPSTWWEQDPAGTWMLGVRLMAAGPLARWGRQTIGDQPWPQESVAARAARIASLVGAPLVVQGGSTVQVTARDVDAQPAIDVLEDLASDAAGWLFDWAGTTYLQALDARRAGDPSERWDDQTLTWDSFPDGESWEQQTQTSSGKATTVVLPPGVVLWAPPLQLSSQIANQARVAWGVPDPGTGEQAVAVATDQASIDVHGISTADVDTRLAFLADAEQRAQLVLERAAEPQWHLPQVDIGWELLDPATAAAVDGLVPGRIVQVAGLPQPGPFAAFDGCVEGWQETWAGDSDSGGMVRTVTLHLSDVRWSFAVLTWDGIVPDSTAWDGVDAPWDQIITADNLREAA
jgi:hypothetical protein